MRILLTGPTGQLGAELMTALTPLSNVVACRRERLDLTQPDGIRRTIREVRPDVIVNAAAFTDVDRAELEPELARAVNSKAPGVMAEEARALGALLIQYSTDYVFDGAKGSPYIEDDKPGPLNVYGRSKLDGERAVEAMGGRYLILRTAWLFGTARNFFRTILKLAHEREELQVATDQFGSPTWCRTVAGATAQVLKALSNRQPPARGGIYHVCAIGQASRFEFAEAIVEECGAMARTVMVKRLRAVRAADFPAPARRPANTALSGDKLMRDFGISLPGWRDQIGDAVRELLRLG